MSTWQPEKEPLQQLITYLNDSLTGRDGNIQRTAELVSKDMRAHFYAPADISLNIDAQAGEKISRY